MKTTISFTRAILALAMVLVLNHASLSQRKNACQDLMPLPMYYRFTLNQDVIIENSLTIQSWMASEFICMDGADLRYPLDEWIMEKMPREIILRRDFIELRCWMWGICDNPCTNLVQIMEWMFNFEPEVVDLLLYPGNNLLIEKWMYDSWDITNLPLNQENLILLDTTKTG